MTTERPSGPGTPIRVIELSGDAASRGAAHGAWNPDELRAYAADRIGLAGEGTAFGADELRRLADACIPAHRAYAPDLTDEMEAMADAAGVTAADAVVVGGYTDFIDLVRAEAGQARVDDTCTAVVVPDDMADGAGFLAQTWDMHASATPHIVMLDIRPDSGPGALVFSTLGCLGQIGMNEAGIAVGINNLTAADGRVGVTWPHVVRKVLQQADFDAAVQCITEVDLAGGHNFLVFDRNGHGVSIEAMPTSTHIESLGTEPLLHTNHCIAPGPAAVEGPRPSDLDAGSRLRLQHAWDLLSTGPVDVAALMALTRDERAICRRPEPPWSYESCGAVIMRPVTAEMWACWGVPSDHDFERFEFDPLPVP